MHVNETNVPKKTTWEIPILEQPDPLCSDCSIPNGVCDTGQLSGPGRVNKGLDM